MDELCPYHPDLGFSGAHGRDMMLRARREGPNQKENGNDYIIGQCIGVTQVIHPFNPN